MQRLRDADAVRAFLSRLGGPALVALTLLLGVAGLLVDLELLRNEVDRRLGAKGWGLVAQEALDAAGLLLGPGGDERPTDRPSIVLPEVLGEALQPHLVGLADLPVDASSMTVEPSAETAWSDVPLALLLGSFLRHLPRVTQQGTVFATAVDRLAKVFWPGAADARERVEGLIRTARELGLLVLRGGSGHVQPGAVRAWAVLSPAERRLRRLALVKRRGDEGTHAAFGRLLRAAGDGWVRSEELLSRAALALGAYGPQEYYWRRMTARDVTRPAAVSVALLAGLEPIERGKLADGTEVLRLAPAFRPATAVPPSSGGCVYVQPNFEIIVPPDAEFEVVLGLARVAELRRVEDAATLVVTAASVHGARESGWTRVEILAALERAAAGSLPQNVAATVADWAGAAMPARFIEAIVFHCPDPDAAERMRRSPEAAALFERELAPGVWTLRSGRQHAVARAAHAAGVDFMPQVERPERDDPWSREERAGPSDADLHYLRTFSAPIAPPAELAQAVAATRAARPPVVFRRAPREGQEAGLNLPQSPAAGRPPSTPADRIASLFRESAGPFPDPEVEIPDVDLEGLAWMPAPPPQALEQILAVAAVERIDLAIGYRNVRGEAVRRVVAVERLRRRRGRAYVDALAFQDEESISLPVDEILELAVVELEDRPLFEPFLTSGPRAPVRVAPQVGRNDPCPCGSGRKYKRCCGR